MSATPRNATPEERAKAVVEMMKRSFGWAPNWYETIEARIAWEIREALEASRLPLCRIEGMPMIECTICKMQIGEYHGCYYHDALELREKLATAMKIVEEYHTDIHFRACNHMECVERCKQLRELLKGREG